MFGWLRKLLTPAKTVKPSARYDAARSGTLNDDHWSNADSLSANQANSPDVRATIRNRARMEVGSNSYAEGVVRTIANEQIGRGPRLQMRLESQEDNQRIEQDFRLWMQASGFAKKLHAMARAKVVDGEACAMLVNNENLVHPVKLDVRVIEADRLTTPFMEMKAGAVDGIEFDDFGNPREYHVLREHPGDNRFANWQSFNRVPASQFIHWFTQKRPEQNRGVSELAPCLPLFAQLRRWTLATLTSAEIIAKLAIILQASPDGDDPIDFSEFETSIATILPTPPGATAFQPKAEQPVGTYPEFKHEILKEIGRPVNMPYAVTAGDASMYNFASLKADVSGWVRSIEIERAHGEPVHIERVFQAYLAEALLRGMLPDYIGQVDLYRIPHRWFWDGMQSIDPVKEETANALALANYTTTLADIWAAKGEDADEKLVQAAAEKKRKKELELDDADVSASVQDDPTTPAKPRRSRPHPAKRGVSLHLNGYGGHN